ncbi:MAG: hypothetical protein P0Y49_04930 [Candidatus Pedobacter colombiensis]|uniref:Uncharacterized protein n=1 Tax=Candidatus Pedobacter colombiensis TaxID=3121371 RepID=A0AAJ5W9J2_9SPHI|nr:hypothetical protein [Pedobacter sp.]WEK20481.1 MAG: hypothetical protein P0Y49_04930 [Pedobacter sp.]
MKDSKKLTNIFFYISAAIGVLILLYELFSRFISFKLFIHGMIAYALFFVLFLMSNHFKIINRIWVKISILLWLILTSFFYFRYLYKVDLFVLVVPLGYKGKVELKINNLPSSTKVRPLDGVVFFEIKENGKFSTSSNFDVSFNRIGILERSGGSFLANSKLRFINKNSATKKDSLNRIYTIIEGDIIDK